MNIREMKAALGRFRKADVSVIKDEALRAKAQKLQAKQGGFTLLELLVVITLLAVLSTAALVAYEGIGENAEAVAAANTAATIDRAIRTYKAVEGAYPDQWDNLTDYTTVASPVKFAPVEFNQFLASWTLGASNASKIQQMFVDGDTEELQFVDGVKTQTNIDSDIEVAPNKMHNESNNPNGGAVQIDLKTQSLDGKSIAVLPSDQCAGVTALNNAYPDKTFGGTIGASNNKIQNAYADILEQNACNVVAAFGFGSDAAASTSFSRVAIAQSPTYSNGEKVNPAEHYSRFIGLFHLGGDNDDGVFEWRPEPRLLAIVTPDGKNIDTLVAESKEAE